MEKLYNVPRNSKIGVEHLDLFDKDGKQIKELDFEHVDGMYAHCRYKGKIVYLFSTTEVLIIDKK